MQWRGKGTYMLMTKHHHHHTTFLFGGVLLEESSFFSTEIVRKFLAWRVSDHLS